MTKQGGQFQSATYELPGAGSGQLLLRPIDKALATQLAEGIARIDPWQTLRISPTNLAANLLADDDSLCRRAVWRNAECAGVVSIRSPWLYGPYLALLAILPGHQGVGIGPAILQWIETEVRGSASNLWACVSSFNGRAQAFYERHGFQRVGTLPDLVRAGYAEILIRKQLG